MIFKTFKRTVLIVIPASWLLVGCGYEASPMQCYHDHMRLLNAMGNFQSAIDAGCVSYAESALSDMYRYKDKLKWEKCKEIFKDKSIEEYKAELEKKKKQKKLRCKYKQMKWEVYYPSQPACQSYLYGNYLR